MMKIVVLFDTYLYDRKGLFNAIINRTKSLMALSDVEVDMICLQGRPAGLNRLFRKSQRVHYEDTFKFDGLTFRLLWYKRFFIDDILFGRLHCPPFMFRKWARRVSGQFMGYDIISAHSTRCGEMARLINKRFGTPFFVTWHGTDIHTTPFLSRLLKQYVSAILYSATCNFFVSKALSDIAKQFAHGFRYEILYNGVSDKFYRYGESERELLRRNYSVAESKVIAFAGNLIPVKNVILLPEIFQRVKVNSPSALSFWIIGDGSQRKPLEIMMAEKGINCKFWGNIDPDCMPDMMNCIDVLVLPSRNESFGLVLVEALACGANAVGSRVGGIPEVIGVENTFELGKDFVSNISERILYFLSNVIVQTVGDKFNWRETAKLEYSIYKQTCKDNG